MVEEACCTCAALLSTISLEYDEKTEKPVAQDRRLDCCGRVICGKCIAQNNRFSTYCPFCQISNAPSSLPQGLYDPPTYSPSPSPRPAHATLASPPDINDPPPSYSSLGNLQVTAVDSKAPGIPSDPAPDVLHFLHPNDTLASLSLAYNTPISALRRTNGLFADHLLAARRTILVPGEHYKGGVSLSSRPVEGEEEEIRRGKVRRWMISCKVADYDIALLYLQQADYALDAAIEAYKADEKWEQDHPMESNVKGKMKSQNPRRRKFGGTCMTGQLS